MKGKSELMGLSQIIEMACFSQHLINRKTFSKVNDWRISKMSFPNDAPLFSFVYTASVYVLFI